jgi:hypothetical protein
MLYFSRDFRNNERDEDGNRQSRVEETGLGFLGTYESGFTQGTVGVGVDAIGMLGLKLDSGKAAPVPACSQPAPTAVRRMTTPRAAARSNSAYPTPC